MPQLNFLLQPESLVLSVLAATFSGFLLKDNPEKWHWRAYLWTVVFVNALFASLRPVGLYLWRAGRAGRTLDLFCTFPKAPVHVARHAPIRAASGGDVHAGGFRDAAVGWWRASRRSLPAGRGGTITFGGSGGFSFRLSRYAIKSAKSSCDIKVCMPSGISDSLDSAFLRMSAGFIFWISAFTLTSVTSVIVQFGGQTPLNLALELKRNGVPIIGTAPESIDLAEDRRRFGRLLDELRIPQPRNGTALIPEEAARVAGEIGLPVLVRPSYVLGGRAMVIAYDVNTVQEYVAQAALMGPARPVLIDQFLEEATEVDVDALSDGTDVVIGGIMEHIEEAGVHSGDSSCVLPPVSLPPAIIGTIREYTRAAGAWL